MCLRVDDDDGVVRAKIFAKQLSTLIAIANTLPVREIKAIAGLPIGNGNGASPSDPLRH